MKNQKMPIYSVMLEGTDASMGYFMNIEVCARNPTEAAKLARECAKDLGLKIVGVETITETNETCSSGPGVLSTSGKSYFPAEQ